MALSATLNEKFAISNNEVEYYNKNGHVRINGILDDEPVAGFRKEVNVAVNKRKETIKLLPFEERDSYGKAFMQIMNLWPDYPDLAQFVLSKRLASVAAQLLGVERVRIYHDQALYKEPHGGITPWHQDQHYWPLETNKCVTMWMPLMDVPTSMATLNFASGTGNVGYLGDMPISDESEEKLSTLCKERGFEIVNHGNMNAGDATFHSGWCLHGAPGNHTNVMREVMTIIWFADETKIIADPDPQNRWNNGRRNDLKMWLPDRQPGEMADGRLNPLISPFE